MEDKEKMAGKKISTEPDVMDWFLAIKPGLWNNWTKEASQRNVQDPCKGSCNELTLWPEAMATKTPSLTWEDEETLYATVQKEQKPKPWERLVNSRQGEAS